MGGMNKAIHEYTAQPRGVNIILIREYIETGRIEAMARTLDDIQALPEAKKETR